MFFVKSVMAQTLSNTNFVRTLKPKKEVKASDLDKLSKDEMIESIAYFDGLGRPIQKISGGQSSAGKDIVTHIAYDSFGRQVLEYLPYEASSVNMAYATDAETATKAFYNTEKYENTSNPFSEKKLESSPLNRILRQAAPGNPWAMDGGHEIKFDYQTNTADEVKLYKASAAWNAGSGLYDISLSDAGYYQEAQLFKNITYDENTSANLVEKSGSTVEFKNKEGQVVLKRTYDAGEKHDTYYVYDVFGNLTYVIPPKAEGIINDEMLNGLCYQYKYDSKNRLAEKKLPGKQWEFIVYDKLDRPVATGPAFSPFKDDNAEGWIITKYDAFGRPIYTGWSNQASNSAIRKSLQDAQNSKTVIFETKQTSGTIDGIEAYYSNTIEPVSFKLLTVNYYDSYAFPNAQPAPASIEGQLVLSNVKTLSTGSWKRALTTASSTAGETSTIFYDDKARPIKNYLQNHLGGYTSSESKIDFAGKTLYTITKHKRTSGDAEIVVREEFTYSPQDRLLTHTHQINGGTVELLTDNSYDALGQLMSKKTGANTGNPLQKVDFQYNIRGWLKEINKTSGLQQDTDPADLFAFKINYNTIQTDVAGVLPLYNGNISETFWKTSSDLNERAYGYKYDNLNRLKNAVYEKNGLTTSAYDENLTYDKNGNIKTLNRKGDYDQQVGSIEIDDLVYAYANNSNQLTKVADNSNNSSGFNDASKTDEDYSYDGNGNMIADKNKNITAISYNHLNLPKKITFGTTGSIEYFYNASGQKTGKAVTEGTVTAVTDYLSGYQYKENVLEFFPTAEGYIKNTDGVLSYVFQYKDHLGNVRVSYVKNPATQVPEIIEENNYYPFGLKHKGYNDYLPTANKYKYNGKELQDELGLGMYDMEARNYMPDIGRWGNIDALAESFFKDSPYSFSNNNPIFFADPSGLSPESTKEAFERTIVNGSGKVLEHRDDGDPGIYLADFGWREGDSTNGLSLVGFEKPGVKYNKGDQVLIDIRTGYGFVQGQRKDDSITPIGGAGDIFGIIEMLSMTTDGNSDILALLFIMRGKGVNSSALGIGNEHHLIPVAVFKQLKDDLKALMKLGSKKNFMSLTTPFHGNHPQFSKYVKNQILELKNAGSLTKASIESLQTNLRAMINKAASEYDKTGKNLNEYFRQFNK